MERAPSTSSIVPKMSLCLVDTCLAGHLEDHFQLDRGAERQASDAVHQAARVLVFAENILQQLRRGVGDHRLIADVARRGYRPAGPPDPRNLVERSQMLPRDGEDVERGEEGRLAPGLKIELGADPP